MKKILVAALTFILVLTMTAMVFAEGTEAPAIPETDATSTATESDTDNSALQEAIDAYRTAKQASAVTDYEAELKAMVESGALTQDQADLLLKYVKEQEALRNNQCPNCGYSFETCTGARGMGGGSRMMNGIGQGMNGGRGRSGKR